ncbi:MAG: mannosyltransferase family protein [Actinomycetota bacterium]
MSVNAAEPRLREGLRDVVVVFLVARLLLFGLSAVTGGLLLPPPPGQPTTDSGYPAPALEPGWHMLFTATERQDGLWFLRLGTQGYSGDDASAAFFPLYPVLVRTVSWLPLVGPLGAALLVSNVSFFAALLVLHALTRRELGARAAPRALRFVALFPTAFFFLAPYSESLFLLLSVSAFWFARRERWALAGAAAAAAALTRSVGAVLILALAVEAVRQWRGEGRAPLPRLAGAAAAAAGPLLYLGWWQVRFGDFWAPLDAQRAWRPDGPAEPIGVLVDAVRLAWEHQTWWLIDLAVVAMAIAGIVLVARRIPLTYTVYAAASLLLPLLFPLNGRPLMSMPRFVAVLFPAAWGFARLAERRPRAGDAILLGAAAGYGILVTLFVNWLYIF